MSSNSKVTKQSLFEKVISHALISANKYKRPISGYIRDIGFDSRTFYSLCSQRIPQRQKFALFLTLLVDYLNTSNYGKENRKNGF